MSDDTPTTSELLKRAPTELEAEAAALREILIEKARVLVAKRIGDGAHASMSALEVACRVASSVLRVVKDDKKAPKDEDELFRILARRARSKGIDSYRHNTAQKRDVRRNTGKAEYCDGPHKPSEEADVNLQAEKIAEIICEPKDELRRCVNQLSVLGHYSANVIRSTLLKQKWAEKYTIPSVRTIQLWMAGVEARLKREFGIKDE